MSQASASLSPSAAAGVGEERTPRTHLTIHLPAVEGQQTSLSLSAQGLDALQSIREAADRTLFLHQDAKSPRVVPRIAGTEVQLPVSRHGKLKSGGISPRVRPGASSPRAGSRVASPRVKPSPLNAKKSIVLSPREWQSMIKERSGKSLCAPSDGSPDTGFVEMKYLPHGLELHQRPRHDPLSYLLVEYDPVKDEIVGSAVSTASGKLRIWAHAWDHVLACLNPYSAKRMDSEELFEIEQCSKHLRSLPHGSVTKLMHLKKRAMLEAMGRTLKAEQTKWSGVNRQHMLMPPRPKGQEKGLRLLTQGRTMQLNSNEAEPEKSKIVEERPLQSRVVGDVNIDVSQEQVDGSAVSVLEGGALPENVSVQDKVGASARTSQETVDMMQPDEQSESTGRSCAAQLSEDAENGCQDNSTLPKDVITAVSTATTSPHQILVFDGICREREVDRKEFDRENQADGEVETKDQNEGNERKVPSNADDTAIQPVQEEAPNRIEHEGINTTRHISTTPDIVIQIKKKDLMTKLVAESGSEAAHIPAAHGATSEPKSCAVSSWILTNPFQSMKQLDSGDVLKWNSRHADLRSHHTKMEIHGAVNGSGLPRGANKRLGIQQQETECHVEEASTSTPERANSFLTKCRPKSNAQDTLLMAKEATLLEFDCPPARRLSQSYSTNFTALGADVRFKKTADDASLKYGSTSKSIGSAAQTYSAEDFPSVSSAKSLTMTQDEFRNKTAGPTSVAIKSNVLSLPLLSAIDASSIHPSGAMTERRGSAGLVRIHDAYTMQNYGIRGKTLRGSRRPTHVESRLQDMEMVLAGVAVSQFIQTNKPLQDTKQSLDDKDDSSRVTDGVKLTPSAEDPVEHGFVVSMDLSQALSPSSRGISKSGAVTSSVSQSASSHERPPSTEAEVSTIEPLHRLPSTESLGESHIDQGGAKDSTQRLDLDTPKACPSPTGPLAPLPQMQLSIPPSRVPSSESRDQRDAHSSTLSSREITPRIHPSRGGKTGNSMGTITNTGGRSPRSPIMNGGASSAQEQEDDAVSRWKTVSTETDNTGIDDEPLFENPKDEP
jgi:hypothetical protein